MPLTRIIAFALIIFSVALAASPASAGITLAYDSPVLNVTPGGSVEVRAKLSVSSDWGNASTDGTGTLLPLNPYFATTFSVGVQSFPDILVCSGAAPFSCQPLYPLQTYGTAPSPWRRPTRLPIST